MLQLKVFKLGSYFLKFENSIIFLNIAFWLVSQNNKKIKNDNKAPEKIEIKIIETLIPNKKI